MFGWILAFVVGTLLGIVTGIIFFLRSREALATLADAAAWAQAGSA